MQPGVGIGIVGGGFAGRVHALAARAVRARLVGVTSSSPARSQAAAAALGAERGFGDLAELVQHPAVEVVHVCTPNAQHRPVVDLALRHGKHVICEKPLGISSAEAAGLAALAAESGLRAAVCFAYRYQSMARQARDKIRNGELGAVQLIQGTYLQDWLLYETDANWRVRSELGGASRAFADIGSHWCDLAEWITGHRITDLVAVTSTVHDKRARGGAVDSVPAEERDLVTVDTEDIMCLVFRATGGVVGTLTVSQVSPGRKNRLWIEVDAAESSVVFDQENAEWLWLGSRDGSRVLARGENGAAGDFPGSSALPPGHARGFVECFSAMFADVYRSVRTGEAGGFPSFEDGLRSARLTDAALRSAASGTWEHIE